MLIRTCVVVGEGVNQPPAPSYDQGALHLLGRRLQGDVRLGHNNVLFAPLETGAYTEDQL